MGAVVEDWNCKACGEKHRMFLADGLSNELAFRYEYTCPKTQEVVEMANDGWEEVVGHRPRGSILVRRKQLPVKW